MNYQALSVQTRSVVGNDLRKLRKTGVIPAVMYNNKTSPISIQFDDRSFYRVFKISGKNQIIQLDLDGDKKFSCVVHDLDLDPVSGLVRHVDFMIVNLSDKVTVMVPVNYVGESPAIKELGGVLNTGYDEIKVSCVPSKIPSEIVVDLSSLHTFHDSIRLSDLKNSDYDFEDDETSLVASITQSTVEVEDDNQIEDSSEEGEAQATDEK